MKLPSRKRKSESLVGLDIDARSVAAVELRGSLPARTGIEPMPPGAMTDGEVTDPEAAASAIERLFSRGSLAKNVRLAVANQSVAFRTVRLPLIEDKAQLTAAVRFQAQEEIPMPLEAAVIDHQVIGGSVSEEGNRQIDVAVVAARQDFVRSLLDVARRAGLDPEGVDLAAFGMIRALAPEAANGNGYGREAGGEEFVQATLYCSLGDLTNLAIASGRACLFSRVAQYGMREVVKSLRDDSGLSDEHAQQWLLHTGFGRPLSEIEGDPATAEKVRTTLEGGAARLADELRLSLDYYGGQDTATPVGDIVLCGWGAAISGIAEHLCEELGRTVRVAAPPALSGLSPVEAARLTLPYGLSLER